MDALPDFRVLQPATLDEALAARARHPDARALGGGTDLVVNIRRGIVAPTVLIDLTRVRELHAIHADILNSTVTSPSSG
jgi:4-hydroxybenzoyl-CoA reductase subunit beta